MAEDVKFICNDCGHAIEAWSDGNPYHLDQDGNKQYAYHKRPEHSRCIGNDRPHLCLDFGHDFKVDSLNLKMECPECDSVNFVETFKLDGQKCLYYKSGVFTAAQNFHCIS